jgi:hypothetical protein
MFAKGPIPPFSDTEGIMLPDNSKFSTDLSDDRLLTFEDVAELENSSKMSVTRRWKSGDGPPFFHVGERRPRTTVRLWRSYIANLTEAGERVLGGGR